MTCAAAEHAPQARPVPDGNAARATVGVFLSACLVYGLGLGSFGLIARGEPPALLERWAPVAAIRPCGPFTSRLMRCPRGL